MTVAFELDGQAFTALNGGPVFTFNEAVSLQVNCSNQEEVDYYWDKLSKGGDPKAQQCGWLKDNYGLAWQVVPTVLPEMLKDHESPKAQRAMEAMLRMKKRDGSHAPHEEDRHPRVGAGGRRRPGHGLIHTCVSQVFVRHEPWRAARARPQFWQPVGC
jgi:hypothetical protein